MFPTRNLKIGRILGIDIVINFTWLLIFFLVAYSFGDILKNTTSEEIVNGTVVINQFPGGPWPWIVGVITALVFFGGLLLHELSHSFVARRNGVQIRRITLFIFGGVAEMKQDVQEPGAEFRMAIAGPLVTFILGGAFYGLYRLANAVGWSLVLVAPLYYLAFINLFIGVFNLLPGFPLDGGRVLRSIIWKTTGDLRKATRAASITGQVIGGLMVATGLYSAVSAPTYLIGGVWLILIGIFLFQLARNSYRQTIMRMAASDTTAGDIMYTDVPAVDENTSLNSLKNNYFSVYHLPALPITRNGDLAGMVTREGLQEISGAEWDLLDAGRVMKPVPAELVVAADTPLDQLMKPLLGDAGYLLVEKDGEIAGLITREELLRYLEVKLKTLNRK